MPRMDPELERGARRCWLSPAELLAARTRDHKIPQRSHGQKDFTPDGSKEQEERLLQCREEHWQLLEEERVERLGSLVKAEWKPQEGIVELTSPAGKFWHTMGFTEHGKQCLLPEEALYLLECGSIQLFYKDLPLSVQEAYESLLSEKLVSLLNYQVFSHLKRLGYIVLRFHPCTVPTPYERQLNLDDYYQSIKRSHRKRKRSISPRLQDEKPKVSEKSQECKESPKKARKHHKSSGHLASGGSSKARTKDSDPVAEPVPSSSSTVQCDKPLACTAKRDHKKKSTRTSWETHDDIRQSRWDFATIAFPNMGADCPQTLLSEPDKSLLPENVTAREVDASRWRRKLNQKRERLTYKEREQLEWESRYKRSINEDKEVRQCSSWQEYKALLEKWKRLKERTRPAHLWEQAVTPLVKPDQSLSTADILQQINVCQPSCILDGAAQLQNNSKGMKIDFDVYQADAASSFKKNNPGKPYVRICVRRFDEQIPSLRAVKQLAFQSGDIPVIFALVDNGDIAFYSFKEFRLPTDIYP
ncbi:tRNA-splicing endonuclease subunit Sen54 [Tiliqua scincoides]|uniref:tRNA-splicing endonuclease subunit Sen54 n=1 Tax=Tiliqua scincoides TaxID=71010 RepID=UPI003461C7B4